MTVKSVRGFLSDDGKFFDTYEQAEFHDAKEDLTHAAVQTMIDPQRLITAVDSLRSEIQRYMNAKEALEVREVDNTGDYLPPANLADDGGTEEEVASILEQPIGSSESVPDVGSGTQSEGVQNRRSRNGSRSRRDNA